MNRITSTAGKRRGESDGSDPNGIDGVYTMHTIGGSEFNKNMHGRGRLSEDNERRSTMVLRDDLPQSSPNKIVIKSGGHTRSNNTSQESILRAESRQAGRSSDDDAATHGRETNTRGITVTKAFGVKD